MTEIGELVIGELKKRFSRRVRCEKKISCGVLWDEFSRSERNEQRLNIKTGFGNIVFRERGGIHRNILINFFMTD